MGRENKLVNDSEGTPQTAILHFAAPPAVGGVEEVIRAHAGAFAELDLPLSVIAGVGKQEALPPSVNFIGDPLLDTRNSSVLEVTEQLAEGNVSEQFTDLKDRIKKNLRGILASRQDLIVHNVLTVHVNLPLTAALVELLDEGVLRHCIAWCHDFSWTMKDYVHNLHDGYPWDILRSCREDISYVVVSERRRAELAELFQCDAERIRVIYDGVDVKTLMGLSETGYGLVQDFDIMNSDLFVLMPIRIVKSKNIEYALNVARAVKDRGINIRLVVTGPPDPHDRESLKYYSMLRDKRSELGLEDNVKFVYESGPAADTPLIISAGVVGDFMRMADAVLIASHSEGFGMPVLEAGLAGKPVFTTDIPAAREIGGKNVMHFDSGGSPGMLADRILESTAENPVHRHRVKVRQKFTWRHLVERDLLPLLGAPRK